MAFSINPDAETIDIVALREADFHLNALPFLEPPVFVNLSLESLDFQGNTVIADIGLRHPFLGLNEFTGFDVCGILISNGSVGGFSDTDLLFPGPDDLHLVNPDGFTRWWNPSEFPSNGTVFGYTDGMLGTPYSVGGFTATVNGYKYYCNDLEEPNAPIDDVNPDGRGFFSAGQKNVRRFTIDMGTGGLVFNYAVDASWTMPDGSPPYDVPDDFPPGANRPEAWNISVEIPANTLYNDGEENGGELSLNVLVYDWFDAGLNTVTIESPGNFDTASSATPAGGGTDYSTYSIDIIDATPGIDEIELLISVECGESGYGGMIPGAPQGMYWFFSVPVSAEAPGGDPEDPIVIDDLVLPTLCDDIVIQGDYAYVVARYAGLHIIDITDPEAATIVKTIDTPDQAMGVDVEGGYAYVADYNFGLRIIDIDPPESADIVGSLQTPAPSVQDGPKNVAVQGGYAYTAHYSNGMQVIDVNSPESPFLVNSVVISGAACDVAVDGDFAYVTDYYNNVVLIDISTPGSEAVVNTVATGANWGIATDNGYVYAGRRSAGDVAIVDAVPAASAYLVTTVDTPGYYVNLCISGDYAYLSGDNYPAADGSLQIVAINPPETAYVFSSVAIPGRGTTVAVKDNYAFETTLNAGLQIIKLWD